MLDPRRKLLFAILLALLPGRAAAQICFPDGSGVPGSGPVPDWWSPGASPFGSQTTSFLDDPRWKGAFSHEALEYERFRVVVERQPGATFLVMSWEVRADLPGVGDRLYFGLWDDASNSGNVWRLQRAVATQTTVSGAQGTSAYMARVFSGSGTPAAWISPPVTVPPTLPTWLTSDARVDVSCASPPAGGCDRYAFRIRAPLSAAVNPTDAAPAGLKLSGTTFKFFYQIQDSTQLGVTSVNSFPAGASPASEGGIPPISIPDPSTWKSGRLGSGAGCEGDVQLSLSGIWVNSSGSSQLDFTANDFHAQPLNRSGGTLSNDVVRARFRIANWGSAWLSSPEWRDACTSTSTPAAVSNGSAFDLHCVWSGFDSCPYRPAGDSCGPSAGTKNRHQCILVDLDNAPGSPSSLTFSPQSLFRNMDFDVNSVLTREASVDLRGLPPMANGQPRRDLYLYIQTRNLPKKLPTLQLAGTTTAVAANDDPEARILTARAREISALRARFKEYDLPAQGAIGTAASARIQSALIQGKLTVDQVQLLMPTYVVYVWHDTGRTLSTESGSLRVLEPQPAFGLFLAHDGSLDGWEHRFEGAIEVDTNTYKLNAANESVVTVRALIAPKGELPPVPTISCSRCGVAPTAQAHVHVYVLTALALLGLLRRLRRRRGAP